MDTFSNQDRGQSPNTTVLFAQDVNKIVHDADGELAILQKVNLSIQSGQTVALVGASGSGKSTLLALLAGLDSASSGEIRLFDQLLTGMDENARAALRRNRVGFVFQTFQLLPHLSALENVALPLEIGRLLNSAQVREKATFMLNRVGLGNRLTHTPRTLSGGEQQRVALARAFVTQPELAFADEPTGSLDAATGARIMDLMFSLNQEQHATLILVTHDPHLAARCARRFHTEAGHVTEVAD